jgi:hypothetical protein
MGKENEKNSSLQTINNIPYAIMNYKGKLISIGTQSVITNLFAKVAPLYPLLLYCNHL